MACSYSLGAVFFDFVVFGSYPTLNEGLGALVIVVGMILIQGGSQKPPFWKRWFQRQSSAEADNLRPF
jgi:drug/metabolite transporter (DMT)-like permease